MITFRFPCFGLPPMMSLPSVASTFLKGVSSMDLPAYFVSSGFTSKLSTWLTPPQRKIQMTDLARGGKCALPSGGCQPEAGDSPRATPSRNNNAESASPVKPIPVSRRKERRVTPAQRLGDELFMASSDGDEIVVVEQHQHQVLACALVRGRLRLCREKIPARFRFLCRRRARED